MVIGELIKLMDAGKLSEIALSRMKPEERISKNIADMLRASTLDGSLNCVWFHVPNEIGGGTRNAQIRYAVTKHMGLIPGAPDFVIIGQDMTILAELKTKTGTLNPNQKLFRKWCDKNQVFYVVVRSWEDLESVLIDHNLLKKERVI